MIQNRFHGTCCRCGKAVKPFEGFIQRAQRGDGWLFRHASCHNKIVPVLGVATQPVREAETKVCARCDRHKPIAEFGGFLKCNDCRGKAARAIEALRCSS